MRFLIDMFPVLVFVITYHQTKDSLSATAALMIATLIQGAIIYWRDRKWEMMQKIMFTMVLIFGSLTLLLRDDLFIKWKPTVMYVAMALGLALSLKIWKKNVLHLFLSKQISLPNWAWNRLCWVWVGYCLFMAAVNAWVATYFTTDEWVNFKLWGYIFPIMFLIGQGLFIAKHMTKISDSSESDKEI